MTVHWGDGATDTAATFADAFTHAYASAGTRTASVAVTLDSLTVRATETRHVDAAGTSVGVADGLRFAADANGDPTGTLDLEDDDLILRGGAGVPGVAAVEGLVTHALGTSTSSVWAHTGITSSAAIADPSYYAVGVMTGTDFRAAHGTSATFDGQPVANDDVVVMSTCPGDTNLDGSTDVLDLQAVLDHNGALPEPAEPRWAIGDVNYDGSVDVTDLMVVLDANGALVGDPASARPVVAMDTVAATRTAVVRPADALAPKNVAVAMDQTTFDTYTVTWADHSSGETGFEVYAVTDPGGTSVHVGTAQPNTTSLTFPAALLDPGTAYQFRVEPTGLGAVHKSTDAPYTTPAADPVQAPAHTRAYWGNHLGGSLSGVTVTWHQPHAGTAPAGYVIEAKNGAGTWVRVGTAGAGDVADVVPLPADPGTAPYRFRVRGVGPGGASAGVDAAAAGGPPAGYPAQIDVEIPAAPHQPAAPAVAYWEAGDGGAPGRYWTGDVTYEYDDETDGHAREGYHNVEVTASGQWRTQWAEYDVGTAEDFQTESFYGDGAFDGDGGFDPGPGGAATVPPTPPVPGTPTEVGPEPSSQVYVGENWPDPDVFNGEPATGVWADWSRSPDDVLTGPVTLTLGGLPAHAWVGADFQATLTGIVVGDADFNLTVSVDGVDATTDSGATAGADWFTLGTGASNSSSAAVTITPHNLGGGGYRITYAHVGVTRPTLTVDPVPPLRVGQTGTVRVTATGPITYTFPDGLPYDGPITAADVDAAVVTVGGAPATTDASGHATLQLTGRAAGATPLTLTAAGGTALTPVTVKPRSEVWLSDAHDGGETGPVNGGFTVRRAGDLSKPLVVQLRYDAPTRSGAYADYTLPATEITFAAGESTHVMPVLVSDDQFYEPGGDTLVARIETDDTYHAYTVGTPGEVTIHISDNDVPHGPGTPETGPPGLGGPNGPGGSGGTGGPGGGGGTGGDPPADPNDPSADPDAWVDVSLGGDGWWWALDGRSVGEQWFGSTQNGDGLSTGGVLRLNSDFDESANYTGTGAPPADLDKPGIVPTDDELTPMWMGGWTDAAAADSTWTLTWDDAQVHIWAPENGPGGTFTYVQQESGWSGTIADLEQWSTRSAWWSARGLTTLVDPVAVSGSVDDVEITATLSPAGGGEVTDVAKGTIYDVDLTPERGGEHSGDEVDDYTQWRGDAKDYVTLVNDDQDEQAEPVADDDDLAAPDNANFTASAVALDDELLKVTLRQPRPLDDDGSVVVSLSDPSAVKLFRGDGSLLYANRSEHDPEYDPSTNSLGALTADLGSQKYLAGLGDEDTVIWVEALKVRSAFTLSVTYYNERGVAAASDRVTMRFASLDTVATSNLLADGPSATVDDDGIPHSAKFRAGVAGLTEDDDALEVSVGRPQDLRRMNLLDDPQHGGGHFELYYADADAKPSPAVAGTGEGVDSVRVELLEEPFVTAEVRTGSDAFTRDVEGATRSFWHYAYMHHGFDQTPIGGFDPASEGEAVPDDPDPDYPLAAAPLGTQGATPLAAAGASTVDEDWEDFPLLKPKEIFPGSTDRDGAGRAMLVYYRDMYGGAGQLLLWGFLNASTHPEHASDKKFLNDRLSMWPFSKWNPHNSTIKYTYNEAIDSTCDMEIIVDDKLTPEKAAEELYAQLRPLVSTGFVFNAIQEDYLIPRFSSSNNPGGLYDAFQNLLQTRVAEIAETAKWLGEFYYESVALIGEGANVVVALSQIAQGKFTSGFVGAIPVLGKVLGETRIGASALFKVQLWGGDVIAQLDSAACKLLGRGCFLPGTLVQTADGSRPIEQVGAGDRVWAYDTATDAWQLNTVTAPFAINYAGSTVTLNAGGEVFSSTGNHPVWVAAGAALDSRPAATDVPPGDRELKPDGRWVAARDVRVGDLLLSRAGGTVRVDAADLGFSQTLVYNLVVEGARTFAVGPSGILVHNGNCTPAELAEVAQTLRNGFGVVEETNPDGTIRSFRTGGGGNMTRLTNSVKAFEQGGFIETTYTRIGPNGQRMADASGNAIRDTVRIEFPDGFPNFDGYIHPQTIGKEIKIVYSGTRETDKLRAAEVAGFPTPLDYTWHHTQHLTADGDKVVGVMQLVRRDVHEATKHSGGAHIFKAAIKTAYEERGLTAPTVYE